MGTHHLVSQVLEPVLSSLVERDHTRQLLPDDGLGDEGLAKDDTLVAPLHALIDNDPGVADDTAAHNPALVVEVGQNDLETLVLLAEQVLDRNLDIVEGDESGTSGGRVGSLDLSSLDALSTGNEENGKTLLGANGGGEPVGEGSVGDPLLGTVDNVELSIGSLLGGGADSADVGTSEGLGDGQGNVFFTGEDLLDDLVLQLLVLAEVEDGGKTDNGTTSETIVASTLSGSSAFGMMYIGRIELTPCVIAISWQRTSSWK